MLFQNRFDLTLTAGNAIELRDRIARRLPDLAPATALCGHYLAMHAFGLEEMGDYALPERAARTALEHNRQDAPAVHALVHVMEMTQPVEEGRELIDTSAPLWADDSFCRTYLVASGTVLHGAAAVGRSLAALR